MDELQGEENQTSPPCTTTTSSVTDLGPGGYPGDGVCPSVSSVQAVFKSAYDSWTSPASQIGPDGRDELFDMKMLFQLMTKFPPFRPRPLKDITAPGSTPSDLIVDLFMSLETCPLPECMQCEKRIPYHLLIGCSTWNTYEVVQSHDDKKVSQLGLPLHSLQSLTRLVLAWSYVLCRRWVEILQDAGEKAAILRPDNGSTDNFWEMIQGEQWQAIVSHNGKVYYAPFMLRSNLYLDAEMSVVPLPKIGQVLKLTTIQGQFYLNRSPFIERLYIHHRVLHISKSVARMCSCTCYCPLSHIT